jgi:hypothetical protein
MGLTKKDGVGIKDKDMPKDGIREIVRTEILDAITEVVIPALDQVYSSIEDFKAETRNNFSDVNRKLSDLSMDTPSREEFKKHDHRIQRLEHELGLVLGP